MSDARVRHMPDQERSAGALLSAVSAALGQTGKAGALPLR